MTYSRLRRRDYLITASAAISSIGVAGCLENDVDGDGGTDNQGDGDSPTEDPNGEEEQGTEHRPAIESFNASDFEVGDEDQRVRIALSHVEPGEEVDIYVDASSLTEANVDVDDLGIQADTGRFTHGWNVIDAELTVEAEILIRVTATVEEQDNIDDLGNIEIDLTGLRTDRAEHTSGLQHYGTITTSNGDPDFNEGEVDTYDVIDPDELENVGGVGPGDIRIGGDTQEISIGIEHPSPTIDFRIDITPLSEAGVDFSSAEVIVDESMGEHAEDGRVDIEIEEATVQDGIIRLRITQIADADGVIVDFRVTNLETDDAEPTTDMTYPVYIGEGATDPQESGRFSISGATA